MFNRPKFKNSFHLFSDIDIDKEGIHDGFLTYSWEDIVTCTIGDSDVKELKKYFGDSYNERPYSLTIKRKGKSTREITLFGQSWDRVVVIAKAINYYSGRQLIPPEQFQGKPIPLVVIIAFSLFLLSVIAIFVVHALQQ